MSYRKHNPEVVYTTDTLPLIGSNDVAFLKEEAAKNPRERMRICVHTGPEDVLHEMFILHKKGCYVRPHRHNSKAESLMVLEGEVDLFTFDDQGKILEVVPLASYGNSKPFFYRMQKPTYHSLLIKSENLVFLETTSGPFTAEGSTFPAWAPANDDLEGQKVFMKKMEDHSRNLR